ncbi:RDD family protein [Paraburkholderia strydomiana]|uniref:RDD family protein n=1 Tax=Paraburkholderia strydomiana TaxID=1245417 RepID=UPI0038BD3AA8
MQLTSNQKGGVVASCVWATVVLVYAFSGPRFSDQVFLRYGILPLGIGWAVYFLLGLSVMGASPASTTATAGEGVSVSTPTTEAAPEKTSSEETRTASAGIRHSARFFDLTVWSFVFWGFMDFFVKRASPAFDNLASAFPWSVALLLPALALPVLLACDAASYWMFGDTPGKALLRITVLDRNGVRLTPRAYARRSVGVWGAGCGYGLPLWNFIALAISSRRLTKTGYTNYDAEWGDVVVQKRVSVARGVTVGAASFLALALLQQVFIFPLARQLGAAMGANLALYEVETYGWTNPITNRRVILRDWKLVEAKIEDKGQSWSWTRYDGARLVVYYGIGNSAVSLNDVAGALRAQPSGIWHLTGSGDSFGNPFGATYQYFWEGRRALDGSELPWLTGPASLITRLYPTDTGIWYMAYVAPQSNGSYEDGHATADAIMKSAAPR